MKGSGNKTKARSIFKGLILMRVFKTLITQLYFDGASFSSSEITRYNEEDLILSRLPFDQQAMLIVQFQDSPELEGNKLGVFNLYLQRL